MDMKHQDIAAELATRLNVITHWTKRWSDKKDDPVETRLQDGERSGRPPKIEPSQVCALIALACESPQAHGRPITHWTHRELAEYVEHSKRRCHRDTKIASNDGLGKVAKERRPALIAARDSRWPVRHLFPHRPW